MLIGIVLGGSQALSRSLFSQLVPHSREAEFFGLYQAMERGTSLVRDAFLFGLVHQLTDSYRPAIVALIIFFVLGYALLRTGRRAAGHPRRRQRGPRASSESGGVRTVGRLTTYASCEGSHTEPFTRGEATEQRHRSGRWTR